MTERALELQECLLQGKRYSRSNIDSVLAIELWIIFLPLLACCGCPGSMITQSTCILWIWRGHMTVSSGKPCGILGIFRNIRIASLLFVAWFCWLHQTVTFCVHRGSFQVWAVSTVHFRKLVDCSLKVEGNLQPHVKYLGGRWRAR